jgi:hypothetical protein
VGLKKSISWLDTIWEYKGTSTTSEEEAKKIKTILNGYFKDLQKCKKN